MASQTKNLSVWSETTNTNAKQEAFTFQKMYNEVLKIHFDWSKDALSGASYTWKPRACGKGFYYDYKWLKEGTNKLINGKDKQVAYLAIGDTVRITGHDIDDDEDSSNPIGTVGTITDICRDEDNDNHNVIDHCSYEVNNNYFYGQGSLELANNKEDNNMSTVSNDPIKALRELNLDADTRLLRELGFEDEQGNPCSRATIEMARRQWVAVRAEIAADLRTAMANEQSDKEANTDKA